MACYLYSKCRGNLGISERIIMHNIQLRNTRKRLRKALLFLVLLFTLVPSRWRGVRYWGKIQEELEDRRKALSENNIKREGEAVSLFLFPSHFEVIRANGRQSLISFTAPPSGPDCELLKNFARGWKIGNAKAGNRFDKSLFIFMGEC